MKRNPCFGNNIAPYVYDIVSEFDFDKFDEIPEIGLVFYLDEGSLAEELEVL